MITTAFWEIMVNVQRLGHIAIRVEDMDRAIAFYLSLGMKVVWQEKDWSYLETVSNANGLALLGPEYKAAGPHFAFHFTDREDVNVMHRQLQEGNVDVGELHEHRNGTASFYLKDPEGNWLEMLYEPPGGFSNNQKGDENSVLE